MDNIETMVKQVIDAFDARRRTRWSLTSQQLAGVEDEVKQWHGLVAARLEAFRRSVVDRTSLLKRVRERFKGQEWTADFAGVAEELQRMERDNLRRYLVENGMSEEAARKLTKCYSIGALLHEE